MLRFHKLIRYVMMSLWNFKYHMVEEPVCGISYIQQKSYDLMDVVILNLGDADQKSDQEILNLLNVLFSADIPPEEKKKG